VVLAPEAQSNDLLRAFATGWQSRNHGIRDLIEPHRLAVQDDRRQAGLHRTQIFCELAMAATEHEEIHLHAEHDLGGLERIERAQNEETAIAQRGLDQLDHSGVLVQDNDRCVALHAES
jgi:hypothetical protein